MLVLRAILDLKNQRDKLRQYQKRITVLTDRETAIAKECLARDDRRRALLALRRKKYQETLLSKTDAQLEQLEQLTSQVEFSLVQKDVLFGLQQGTKVLQAINKEMGGIEAVEKLMGETEEARAYQEVKRRRRERDNRCANHMPLQEISQMLAGQLSNQDEDEVENELERLRQETEAITLPKVPTAPPVMVKGKEADNEEAEISAARMKTRTAVPAS